MNRLFHGLALVILLASLLTGTAASGAQTPATKTYTWQPHDLSIQYPEDWTVEQKQNAISLRPAGRDVSDGRGPELVLFEVPGTRASQLDASLASIVGGSGATGGETTRGTLEGRETLSITMTWTNPDASGVMMLIALDEQTVIGAAYVVRAADSAVFLPVLEQMQASIRFEQAAPAGESSVSVLSVQLPQRYEWLSTGLVLYFPADWTVELDKELGVESLVATPDQDTARGDDRYHLVQGTTLEGMEGIDLRAVAEFASADYQVTSDFVETTVAGQTAVTYDLYDDSMDPPLHLRPLIMPLPDGKLVLFVFGARETAWERFRPLASAMISSIELAENRSAALIPEGDSVRILASRVPPANPAAQLQDDPPAPFVWEEYGISFTLPDGWQGLPGNGQEYDLVLVSPEAAQGGQGAYITLTAYPGLAAGDTTLASALQPVADDLDQEVQAFEVAGLDGQAISYTDEANGVERFHVLIPYETRGDAIYIQANAPAGGGDVITGILDSMVVEPPQPDYAAVDAAWQTSLAEQERLIVGDPDAPVKMREYLSFTCGHCVRYSRSIEHLIALEVEEGRVQYEASALAGDEMARNATLATYCATEQGKGFTVSEALFQGYMVQGPETAYSRDGLNDLLGDLGLDMDALNACMDGGTYDHLLEAVRTDFYDRGLTGTPTVLLGAGDDPVETLVLPDGQIWSGTIPLHYLRDMFRLSIDEGKPFSDFFNQ